MFIDSFEHLGSWKQNLNLNPSETSITKTTKELMLQMIKTIDLFTTLMRNELPVKNTNDSENKVNT